LGSRYGFGAGLGAARVAAVVLAALGGLLSLAVAPAAATVTQFGSEGEAAGQFFKPDGIAVDQTLRDVYVVDRGNQRVDRFGSEGEFKFAWGWGVADGKEELETCTTSCFSGIEGSGAGQFNLPKGVAVDNDPSSASHHDVYVVDAGSNRVEKFTPAGGFLLSFGIEPSNGDRIAVDAAGVVYVGGASAVQKFSAAGVSLGTVTLAGAGNIVALAVDAGKNIYAKGEALSGVRKYNSSGTELPAPRDESGNPEAITLGPAGELFVADTGGGLRHVLEYDSTGKQLASFDAGTEARSIAVGEGIKELYVLNSGSVSLVSPPPPGPLVLTETAETIQPTTATLNAVVNPEEKTSANGELKYHFEYGETASYGVSSAPEPSTGASFEDRHVTAAISGLTPRTLYHFRLVATNAANQTTKGPDQTFTTLPPVSIDSESASEVASTSARFVTELNPHGLPTAYHFEYGLTTAYEEGNVPVPDGEAGSGTNDVALSVLAESLRPATTYHYRVVAHNSLGTVDGPDQTLTTQGGETAGLLDGRAWELVSPPNKRGVSLEAITEEGGVIQASEGGDGIAYIAKGPIDAEPPGNRSIADTQLLARRGPGGWVTQDIATAHEKVAGMEIGKLSEYKLFSGDLSFGLVEPTGATPLSSQASERTPYRRGLSGEYTPLVTAGNVPPGTQFGGEESKEQPEHFTGGVLAVAAAPDLSHIVLSSPQALTPGFVSGGKSSLYEWSGGSLQLISILPPNGKGEEKPAAESGFQSFVGEQDNMVRHAVSRDGTRIVFEAENAGLFVRDLSRQETVRLDLTEKGARGAGGGERAVFQDASSNGTKIFFTDAARLTTSATAKEGEPDLYMCELHLVAARLACGLTDLTVDRNAGEAANVLGAVLGVDEAGRYVYFVANGALTAGAAHEDNLYVYDTVTNERRLIAILSSNDAPDWGAGPAGVASNLGNVTARVAPTGRYMAFMSQRSLTGYDNRDSHSSQPDEEVYLYDLATNTVRCVSCNPSGARPVGVFDREEFPGLLVDRPQLWPNRWLAGSIPGWTRVDKGHALYQSRYLANDGRLFFNSADALVPQDANGKEDVYEYEPNGVGSCSREAGCVALISSGTSSEESAFLDASNEGEDVFFMTAAKLAPQDVDSAFDVYDAHVCSTASPCPAAPASVPPPCTTADSCRAAPSPQPGIFGAPPSTTFSGVGNPIPSPAVRPLTRAQKLAQALKLCRREAKRKRRSCETRAKRLYGPAHFAKAKRSGRGGR
jgi:hypothetical protein